jgi:hypothetical protein
MERALVFSALAVVALAAALILRRRRPEPPTQSRWQVPVQLDRRDFDGGERPWLVVVFTSATCDSCAKVTEKAAVLASNEVAYQEVAYQSHKDLHQRYAVDVVPMLLVAGPDGVVRASFVGTPTATDLWAAVAEAREPGTTPEPDLGHPT